MVKNVWMLMLGLILASGLRAIQAEARQLQVYPQNIHSDIVLNIDRSYQDFSFSINPTPLLRTYYDYMIGSYNGNPLQLVPTNNGSLYLMTYHGSRQPTSNRRVFCSRIETDSQIYTGEMTELTNAEGFPGLSIDPVLGTPHYAMQVNYDGDPYQEVMYVSEEMLFGSYEDFFFNQLLVNNPITITSGSTTTTDNTFLWPIVTTGPSPIAGKRRVYVLCSNATGHGSSSRGNPLIAMADFDYEDVELAIPLVWNYVTLPELNDWNIDPITQRQMYLTILTDTAGSVYLCGYHDTTIGDVQTPEIDIIKSTNYGTGTWTRNSFPTNVSSWNPPAALGSNVGYFTDDLNVPYEDSELFWTLKNSSHFNAVMDSDGNIHMPGLWALTNSDGGYYPALQYVKEFVYRPSNNQYIIRDISPRKDLNDTYNANMQPWDMEPPFGEVDFWLDENTHSIPGMYLPWNFPYYDATAHNGAMMSYYNNIKLSVNQEQGMMAAVWQNCTGAWLGQSPWTYTPEIHIALSSDNGASWSEPIILNNIDNPQLAGIKPMWVYPANKIKYVGMQGNRKVGKMGLMFLDDFTWGANALTPPVHPNNDGGQVMFTELEIVFPGGEYPPDPFGGPVGTPNMTINTEVRVNGNPATVNDVLAAYAIVEGVAEIRGKAWLVDGPNPNTRVCQLQLHVENNEEPIYFKIWRSNSQEIFFCSNVVTGQIGGNLGSWPDDMYQINTLNGNQVATPHFNPGSATYHTALYVQILCSTPGRSIYYTVDGTEPNPQSTLYEDPIYIPLGSNLTIKAKAYLGSAGSNTASGTYITIGTLPALTINPPSGTYFFPINVSLSCPISDAQIRYTFDGSIPTEDSPLYTGSLPIAFSITLKARAFKAGWNPGPITTVEYILPVSTDPETPSPAFTGIHTLYPNPFRESVNIRLGIKDTEQDYSLTIYNIRGEVVSSQAGHGIGFLDLVWDGRDSHGRKAAAGIYLLRFRSGETTQTRKLILN